MIGWVDGLIEKAKRLIFFLNIHTHNIFHVLQGEIFPPRDTTTKNDRQMRLNFLGELAEPFLFVCLFGSPMARYR